MTKQSQEFQNATSHKKVDYYTPPEYVELVREVLGDIELDPATSLFAQHWINAWSFWTIDDDYIISTLERDWYGKVFMNPPYSKLNGKSQTAVWCNKLIEQFNLGNVPEAVVLINQKPGYVWYEKLWRKYHICMVDHLIRFIDGDTGKPAGDAKVGSAFLYFGYNPKKFENVFSQIGRVLPPDQFIFEK